MKFLIWACLTRHFLITLLQSKINANAIQVPTEQNYLKPFQALSCASAVFPDDLVLPNMGPVHKGENHDPKAVSDCDSDPFLI